MSAPPWFEDLEVGTVFTAAPAVTLTEGHAALHQSIAGDRLRLALDRSLAEAVAGAPIAHPALVWDVAIGQSTVATGRVVANLFYRGLMLRRPVRLGRHAAHDDRRRRAAREPPQGGAPPHRPRRPAHPHRRPGGPARARLHPLRDAAAA